METCLSEPQLTTEDGGNGRLTVILEYPTFKVFRKVNASDFEGQKGKDLIAAMRRRAEQ